MAREVATGWQWRTAMASSWLRSRWHWRVASALAYCLLSYCLLTTFTASAADRLIDEEPYDLLTVPDGSATKTYRVSPVKLPNRRIPENIKPSDKIRVRLLEDDESRDFEVAWRDVKALELFENRIRTEADKLAAEQKFDEAYDNIDYLLRNFPNVEDLDRTMQGYWYLSAASAFRNKRYDEALSVLEELLKANPTYKHSENSPTLMRVLGEMTDKLAGRYLEAKDYGTARSFISRIASTYPESKQEPFYGKFQERLTSEAAAKRDEARSHLEARRYTEAYDAAAAMVNIWPEIEGGRELAEQIATAYPLVVVGVSQLSSKPDLTSPINWAARRTGRLADRRLMELKSIGPEGGKYAFSLGSCERSDDGASLLITVKPPGDLSVTSYEVARRLSDAAVKTSNVFSRDWAQGLASVRLVKSNQVEVLLRSPPPLVPEALLQFPFAVPGENGEAVRAGSYELVAGNERLTRFVLPPTRKLPQGEPREIQERLFPEPEAALLALERNELDILDRISPRDLGEVQKIPGVAVSTYVEPTLHVIVPNLQKPWTGGRTFRRALMYGINREVILKEGLLKGQSVSGAQLISGPLPAPVGSSDPLEYAYSSDIPPHAYEPLLATTLVSLAKREVESEAKTKGETPPKLGRLSLAYVPSETSKIACKSIAKQLEIIGVHVDAVEVKADELKFADHDLTFVELFVTEPIFDMARLFGAEGLIPPTSSHIRLAVQSAQRSATWGQASDRLHQLHRLLHEDLTVLPLWQLPEYYAYRKNLQGIEPKLIALYQDVDRWRVSSRLLANK